MPRRQFLPALLVTICALIAEAGATEKPNVLLICVDDLKPLLGCYGDPFAKTPNLDKLATRAVLMEAAYCNQVVCAPSRNVLMTGLRPQTLGIYDLGTNFRKARPDATTLSQYFRKHGYRTEALGKIYHSGHGNGDDAASWEVPHFSPWKVGAYQLPENRPARGTKNAKGPAFESADVPDTAYPDGVLATVTEPPAGAPRFAPQFGAELRSYQGIPARGALPEDLQRTLIQGYYAATSYIDAQLGLVLDTLDELDLMENTIIVLWGDHGFHLGDHGMWCKHTNYEQAARIPLMIAAPGIAPARTAALVETVDIYPTLCELAGLP